MAINPIIRKLTALLDAEAPEKQMAAAIVLGELGARDPEVVEALIGRAAAGVPAVQRHAVEALGRLGAKKALPTLVGLLGTRDENLRAAAVAATVAFQDDAVLPVRQRLGAATDLIERRALEEVLGRVGGKDAFAALLAALDTTDAEAGRAATLAIRQRIKDAGARERAAVLAQVTKILDGAKPGTKPGTKLGTRQARAGGKAAAASPTLCAAALKIVGYLEDPAAVPMLLAFAKDGRAPEAVRQEALIALRFTATGAAAARVAGALLDLAETAPVPLARTALFSLASLAVPAALAKRLGALALDDDAARAELAPLAIDRLGQVPGLDAGAELAKILAKTHDRARAEAAATVLGARPEAARALGDALLDAADPGRIQFLTKLLAPRAGELATGGAAEKKLARALVALGVARGADPGPDAHALLALGRALDARAITTGLRALADKHRKGAAKKKAGAAGAAGARAGGGAGTDPLLTVLRRLGHVADATPDDGYALAAAELGAGRRDEALTILRQLLDRGFDVAAALRRDRGLDPEQRYQIGFQLAEQRHPAAEEILGDLARDGGRGKVAQMAKAKLRSSGYAPVFLRRKSTGTRTPSATGARPFCGPRWSRTWEPKRRRSIDDAFRRAYAGKAREMAGEIDDLIDVQAWPER